MTDTLTRSRTTAEDRVPRRGSVVVSAVSGAVVSALLGLLTALTCVLLSWVADPNSSGSPGALLRAGGQLWVIAHRTPVRLPGGRLVLAPLGLTLLMAVFVARAAAATVRRAGAGSRRDAVAAGLAVAPPYALLVALVAGLSRTSTVRPAPVVGLLTALAVAAGAALAGTVQSRGWAALSPGLPAELRAVLPAAAAAVATLLATGAVLAGAALAVDGTVATRLSKAVASGGPTGAALLLLQVGLAPNAVVWGSSYAVGTGFAVGAGTSVAPLGVHLGPVPALPLLAALPESGTAPAWSLLALLGPLVAGGLAGVVLARRLAARTPRPVRAAAWSLAVGLAAGTGLGVLAWCAGGEAPGRLGTLGPSPLMTGVAAGCWVVLGAAPAAWWCTRRRARG